MFTCCKYFVQHLLQLLCLFQLHDFLNYLIIIIYYYARLQNNKLNIFGVMTFKMCLL